MRKVDIEARLKIAEKEVNAVIRPFIQQFEEDYDCFMSDRFMVVLSENAIGWSIVSTEEGGKAFYDDFINRFPCAKSYGLFTLSLLHELGHLEMENEMVNDIALRNTIKSHEEYFALPNERMATDWAGFWIMDNPIEAKQLNNSLKIVVEKIVNDLLTNK